MLDENVFFFSFAVALALLGLLLNGISLFYFLTREKQGLGDRLLISLNTVDLGVCLTAAMSLGYYVVMDDINKIGTLGEDNGVYAMVVWSLYRTTLDLSGYITMVLSVTRMISLLSPFYKIRQIAVFSSILVFGTGRLGLELIYRYYRYVELTADSHSIDTFIKLNRLLILVELSLWIVISASCSLISVFWLQRSLNRHQDDDAGYAVKRKATVTVALITALFCVCNGSFLWVYYETVVRSEVNAPPDKYRWYFVTAVVTIPLNSLLNPMVYVIRKEKLREFVKEGVVRCGFALQELCRKILVCRHVTHS